MATEDLKRMLASHEPDAKMSSLVQTQQQPAKHPREETIVFLAFKVEVEVEDMLLPFFIMADETKPSIFMELWEKSRQKYLIECEQEKKAPSLTLLQVTTLIWKPVYKECKQILQELSSLAMPLKKLKEYSFPEHKEELDKNLRNLCHVLDCCKSIEGETPTGDEWVRDTVSRMLKYCKLCKYADAAETLLKLKEAFSLTGNFSSVEALSQQVGIIIILILQQNSYLPHLTCRFPRMLVKK